MGHPSPQHWQLEAVAHDFPDAVVPPAPPSEGSLESTHQAAAAGVDLAAASVMLNSLPGSADAASVPIIAGRRTVAALVGALLHVVQQQHHQDSSRAATDFKLQVPSNPTSFFGLQAMCLGHSAMCITARDCLACLQLILRQALRC